MQRRTFLSLLGSSVVASASPIGLKMDNAVKDSCFNPSPKIIRQEKIVLDKNEFNDLKSFSYKLRQIRKYVGFGNFNLLNFDTMLQTARYSSNIKTLTKSEIELFDRLFHIDAAKYGFYGEKVTTSMTEKISKRDTVKIPRTGHFLYKGDAQVKYQQIRDELGHNIILTSGVRSVVKQMDLFLNKIVRTRGDVSLASYSIAPPGYSFHGVGDFDVGKVGFGYRNFTSSFSQTDEYKRLINSGYIKIRYTKNNPFGVRFEPWHIKVV